MTNEEIKQLTDIIYRVLFNADGAALRIQFGLPPADSSDVTDDDLRDEMGTLALEMLGHIEDELATWIDAAPYASMEGYKNMTRDVANAWARIGPYQSPS